MEVIQTINYIKNINQLNVIKNVSNYLTVDGYRINMSKYTTNEIIKYSKLIGESLKSINKIIYFDMPYPQNKPRVIKSNIKDNYLIKGNKYIIANSKIKNVKSMRNIIYIECHHFHSAQSKVYYADGLGYGIVTNREENYIEFEAQNSFYIQEGKSFNCGYNYNKNVVKAIDILFRFNKDFRFLLSFVNERKDVDYLYNKISQNINLFPKIETQEALTNITGIAESSKGILLARGDLALNVPIATLLKSSEIIAEQCNLNNIPFIYCTDVLLNMNEQKIPNRSELFDVLYAKQLSATIFILPGIKNYFFEKEDSNIIDIINNKKAFLTSIF